MKVLLDTHALVWWLSDDARLSEAAKQAIATDQNICHVSAASAWEIATKVRLGRWPEANSIVHGYKSALDAENFLSLDVSDRHALPAGSLAAAHKVRSIDCWPRRRDARAV